MKTIHRMTNMNQYNIYTYRPIDQNTDADNETAFNDEN